MGRTRKKYNWKARQVVDTKIDKSEQQKIQLKLVTNAKYDECNEFVLPAKKRKTYVKTPKEKVTKLLSKTQRKKLEKIVDKKNKKENRNSLLESLSKVQVSNDELNLYTPITEVITKGIKRRYNENEKDLEKQLNVEAIKKSTNIESTESFKANSIKGSKKRMRLLAAMYPVDKKKIPRDPNVVGFDSSEESSEEEEEEAIIKEEPKQDENFEVQTEAEPINEEVSEISVQEIKTEKPSSEPKVFIPVSRSAEIQEARLKLPILAEEQVIMETINENPIVILAGETGSGKTTQVPQFLYEAGYARDKIIGITEPRRVAAISMSKRVGEELNLDNEQVSYLIRFEGNVTPKTRIKFMTDGVLLKEIQSDFLLSKYSVIILDEAHERSVYTDILMGLLSRIVPLRYKRNDPLKLIIMSATLRIEEFTENKHLFKTTPPVIKVESRQFPVSIHFNKRTNTDYLKEAFKKACRIHTQLPEGGILMFLTGQQEVNGMVSKLRKAFPLKGRAVYAKEKPKCNENNENEDDEIDMEKAIKKVKSKRKEIITLPEINLDSYEAAPNDDTEQDMLEDSEGELSDNEDWDPEGLNRNAEPMWVLPLYSILPTYKQSKVFKPPPEGCRLCVVATNVAETSLTIPGVKYVIDTGKVKTKLYDKITGVTAFNITWTSKAAANQRAGRAGRTGPGHCYRLYSSAIFNDQFEGWSIPEMQRRAVDELILQMKSLGIQKVVNFPFPSPPDNNQLKIGENKLILLEAIENNNFNGKLTNLGKAMAKFPVAPRFAKMLCLSHQYNLLEYTVAIVAALSVQEILLNTIKISKTKWAGQGNSLLLGDVMILLRIIGAAEFANSTGKLEEFCNLNNVRHKAVIEVRKIRIQLTNEINLLNPEFNLTVNPKMKPPSDTEARLLRQILLSGFLDHVAKKSNTQQKITKPLYNTPEMEDPIQIHNSSALYKEYPEWIIYQEIYETNKIYIRGVTAIEPEWLPIFAPTLCNLTPLDDPKPHYDEKTGTVHCHYKGSFGRSGWELPVVEMEYPIGLDRYRWFAVFFLEGLVCPKLQKYVKSLLSSPGTMIKSWSKLQPRTNLLLKTLVSKEVESREKLYNVWETDKSFLKSAYQSWLPESAQNEIAIIWPPRES